MNKAGLTARAFVHIIILFGITCFAGASEQENELNKAIEMMRAQGMSETEIERFRAMMAPMMAAESERKAQAKEAKARQLQDRATQAANEAAELRESVPATPGVLNLGIQGNTYALKIRFCSLANERHGNLMRVGWVEAAGVFRGEPVIATLSKSHPVGAPSQTFEQLEIWATSRQADEQSLNNAQLVQKRNDEHTAWLTPRQGEIMARYEVTDQMSVDEVTATMQAQQEAFDNLAEEADQRQLHGALARGSISVAGSQVSILSPQLAWMGSGRTPDVFLDIETAQLFGIADCQ